MLNSSETEEYFVATYHEKVLDSGIPVMDRKRSIWKEGGLPVLVVRFLVVGMFEFSLSSRGRFSL